MTATRHGDADERRPQWRDDARSAQRERQRCAGRGSRRDEPARGRHGARPGGPRRAPRHVRRRPAAGTPPGTAACVAPILFPGAARPPLRRLLRRRRRRPRGGPGRPGGPTYDRGRRAGRRRPRRDDDLRARASTCSRWPARCATTRRCGSRSVPRRLRGALPARHRRASCTPSTTSSRSPTAAAGLRVEVTLPRRRPAHPARSSRSTRRTTWHERETWDFFGDRLRRAPGADADPHAGRLAGPPAAQGLPPRRHPGGVQGRHHRRRRTSGGRTTDEAHAASARAAHATAGTDGTRARRTARPRRGLRRQRRAAATGTSWPPRPIEHTDERIVVNMGPQHPSTHGVLRLILELDGEYVTECRVGIGYLHTGIEKTMEFRTWTQGVTLVHPDGLPHADVPGDGVLPGRSSGCSASRTRSPSAPSIIRVLMMELTRISSHLVCLGTGGMELGATTVMTVGFRERERLLPASSRRSPACG